MHQTFLNALNPQPRHVCLRIPLKPLTLGHLFYLQELQSAVVTGTPETFGEILLAVLVCAQTPEQARKMFRRSLWLDIFARYWGWRCRKCDLIEEAQKLRCYLREERAMPPTKTPKGKGKAIAAPWEWVLFDLLCSDYGMTRQQALETPVCAANALWAVHADKENRIELGTAPDGIEFLIHGLWKRRREADLAVENN